MWTSGQNHDIRNYWCSDTKIIKIKCKLFYFLTVQITEKRLPMSFLTKKQ